MKKIILLLLCANAFFSVIEASCNCTSASAVAPFDKQLPCEPQSERNAIKGNQSDSRAGEGVSRLGVALQTFIQPSVVSTTSPTRVIGSATGPTRLNHAKVADVLTQTFRGGASAGRTVDSALVPVSFATPAHHLRRRAEKNAKSAPDSADSSFAGSQGTGVSSVSAAFTTPQSTEALQPAVGTEAASGRVVRHLGAYGACASEAQAASDYSREEGSDSDNDSISSKSGSLVNKFSAGQVVVAAACEVSDQLPLGEVHPVELGGSYQEALGIGEAPQVAPSPKQRAAPSLDPQPAAAALVGSSAHGLTSPAPQPAVAAVAPSPVVADTVSASPVIEPAPQELPQKAPVLSVDEEWDEVLRQNSITTKSADVSGGVSPLQLRSQSVPLPATLSGNESLSESGDEEGSQLDDGIDSVASDAELPKQLDKGSDPAVGQSLDGESTDASSTGSVSSSEQKFSSSQELGAFLKEYSFQEMADRWYESKVTLNPHFGKQVGMSAAGAFALTGLGWFTWKLQAYMKLKHTAPRNGRAVPTFKAYLAEQMRAMTPTDWAKVIAVAAATSAVGFSAYHFIKGDTPAAA